MPFGTVTYTFANNTTADATQVNTNFANIISITSDGTKDFNIANLTCTAAITGNTTLTLTGAATFNGAATLNGAVTLGSGHSNLITISGALVNAIPIAVSGSYLYTLTLPTALPSQTTYLTLSASGTVGTTGRSSSLGQQVSSSCGSFSTSSTSFTNVTNLTVTLTTSGRPVMLIMCSSNTTTDSGVQDGVSAASTGQIAFARDASQIMLSDVQVASTSIITPFLFVDVNATAAAHTYTVQVKSKTGAGAIQVTNQLLIAFEL